MAVVTSPLHSLTSILAKKKRTLVLTPVYNSYVEAVLWNLRMRAGVSTVSSTN
jgi:hypothetical protein